MKNQISVGSQNTRSIGKNSIDQPAQISDKSKVNPWMISTIVVSVLLILSVFLNVRYFKTQVREETPASEIVVSSPTPVVDNQNSPPEKNTLYLGLYEGKEVIFFTNDIADGGGYGAGGAKIEGGPYTGAMTTVGDKPLISYGSSFDFKQLVNPKKIADNFSYQIGLIVDADNGSNKEILFVSLMLNVQRVSTNQPTIIKNVIYKVNVKTQEKQEIWSVDLKHGDNAKYKYDDTSFGGAADISQVADDKYLLLSIGLCVECSPYSEKRGVLVVSINTGKEKFLGMVGDVTINTASNTVTYKKLEAVTEQCPVETAYCNDAIGNGQRNVYKPNGSSISEPLP